jgi:hypothetical protein
MSHRIARVTPQFVTYIPEELSEGVLYVSIDYRVAVHQCCCGCGERVVTPLNPAQWSVTYDGETVSLAPSIAGGRCNSHYFITSGKVRWAPALSEYQRQRADKRDQAAVEARYGMTDAQDVAPAPSAEAATSRGSLWRRLRQRFLR